MKKVLVFLLVLSVVAGSVFAQASVTVSTELGFGNVLAKADKGWGADYAFIGSGDPSDYKAGQATWKLPGFSFSYTVDQLSFSGGLEFKLKDDTEMGFGESLSNNWQVQLGANAEIKYAASDALKVWLGFGDGHLFKPGVSYDVMDGLTLQLVFRLFETFDLYKPTLYILPKVSYSANGIGASAELELRPINSVYSYAVVDKVGTGSDWQTYKAADDNYDFLRNLCIDFNYTLNIPNALKLDLEIGIPLYSVDDSTSGLEAEGVYVKPRVEYNISDAIKVYGDFKFHNIASDKDKGAPETIGFTPAIGLEWTF